MHVNDNKNINLFKIQLFASPVTKSNDCRVEVDVPCDTGSCVTEEFFVISPTIIKDKVMVIFSCIKVEFVDHILVVVVVVVDDSSFVVDEETESANDV